MKNTNPVTFNLLDKLKRLRKGMKRDPHPDLEKLQALVEKLKQRFEQVESELTTRLDDEQRQSLLEEKLLIKAQLKKADKARKKYVERRNEDD